MIKWIRENTALFSLLTGAVIFISTAAVAYHQLSGLLAAQTTNEQHIHDTTRHIDPMRDGMSQKHLVERLERLEEQVRRMEARQRRREEGERRLP